jgi:glycosyltransferase involved in cell wall biosynthesis
VPGVRVPEEGVSPTLDICICSIPHRDGMLRELLAELGRQVVPGVGVYVFRDNLRQTYGGKIAAMWGQSQADYVCCVDDDDMIAPDYVERVMAALESRPDYVGFRVRYTHNGDLQKPVLHSLQFGCWETREQAIVRDISEKNPMRRDLALLAEWEGQYAAEARWAAGIRATGKVKTEVFIDEELYYYRFVLSDHFNSRRDPWAGEILPLPDYPWLTKLGDA